MSSCSSRVTYSACQCFGIVVRLVSRMIILEFFQLYHSSKTRIFHRRHSDHAQSNSYTKEALHTPPETYPLCSAYPYTQASVGEDR